MMYPVGDSARSGYSNNANVSFVTTIASSSNRSHTSEGSTGSAEAMSSVYNTCDFPSSQDAFASRKISSSIWDDD